MGPARLAAQEVEVRFDGLTAIAKVSLAVRRREVMALIGPNGAGKTTLVNCLSGFQRLSAGRILLDQQEVTGWTPGRMRRAGVARTFQAGRLFREMSVRDNVAVTAVSMGLSRKGAEQAAMEMLDWLSVADKADVIAGTLPYTDERRISIARALVLQPAFVMLDEPAAGMSDAECDDLAATIAAIPLTFDCGVLLIEHNMRLIMNISQRIHVLEGGRTIAEGEPHEIRSNEAVIAAYLGGCE